MSDKIQNQIPEGVITVTHIIKTREMMSHLNDEQYSKYVESHKKLGGSTLDDVARDLVENK